MNDENQPFAHKNPDVIGKFIELAARLITPDMIQSDYNTLRDVAGILNPNERGYVASLNRDVEKIAPHITRR